MSLRSLSWDSCPHLWAQGRAMGEDAGRINHVSWADLGLMLVSGMDLGSTFVSWMDLGPMLVCWMAPLHVGCSWSPASPLSHLLLLLTEIPGRILDLIRCLPGLGLLMDPHYLALHTEVIPCGTMSHGQERQKVTSTPRPNKNHG